MHDPHDDGLKLTTLSPLGSMFTWLMLCSSTARSRTMSSRSMAIACSPESMLSPSVRCWVVESTPAEKHPIVGELASPSLIVEPERRSCNSYKFQYFSTSDERDPSCVQ